MLIAALLSLTLWQDPAPAPQATAGAPVQPAVATAPPTARELRLATQRRHNGETVCQTRAPTGSVMNRRMCRTERRVRADATRAQSYVAEVTRGSIHEPHPDIGPL